MPSQANRRPLFIGIGAAAAVVVLALVAFLIVGAVSKAEVPDVAGLTAAEAATALEEAGLSAGSTSEVFDDAVPTGSVVSQVPSAGAEVDRGSPVSLVVSKGVELVTVTMRRDMSSTVLELDLADCDLAVVLWQAAYSDSELVDGDGEVLAGISGGWEAGEDNLEYFPCEVVGTFPGVPTNRDEYRVVFEPDDPIDNRSAAYSRSELAANDWTIE